MVSKIMTQKVSADSGETLFVVNHNGEDTYHYAVITNRSETGQPNQDVFNSERKAYDKHGENLPPRYQVIESEEETLALKTIDSDTPIDGEVVDEVALKQTALDRYDGLTD